MKNKFLFSVFVYFIILTLLSLGFWQIYRLNWKLELIEQIENSLKNNPVELSNNENKTVKEKIFQELKEGYITKEEAEKFFEQEKSEYQDTNKTYKETDITYPRKERIMKLKHYIENKELKIKELCEKMEKFNSSDFQEKMNKIEKNNPERWHKMKTRQESLLLNCQKHIEKHAIYKEKLANLMSGKVTTKYMMP